MSVLATPPQAGTLSDEQRFERLRELMDRKIAFIPNACFKEEGDTTDWIDEPLLKSVECGDAAPQATPVAGLPAHLMRMCKTPILAATEERALFKRMNYLKFEANRIQASLDEDAPSAEKLDEMEDVLERVERIRNHIVQANVRLVMSIAKRFADATNSFDEMLSEGISSLMNAVEKFDYDRGFRFSTYATTSVQRDLYRLVAGNHQRRTRFVSATDEVFATCADEETLDAPQETTASQAYGALTEMLGQLDDRERLILRARFGFDTEGGQKATYTSLGKQLGISKERVRQLAERAIGKLRNIAPEFGLVGSDG